jgi:hypothetical protein
LKIISAKPSLVFSQDGSGDRARFVKEFLFQKKNSLVYSLQDRFRPTLDKVPGGFHLSTQIPATI